MSKKKKSLLSHRTIDLDTSTLRAVFYVRYSSDNQKHESIEVQLQVLEEYAKKNNMIVIDVYSDEAKTATDDNREGFQKMMSDSANGEFNVVLVYKFDRFSRDKFDSVVNKRKLRDNGVTVISALENVGDGPESVLFESIHEGYAEYYSRNLSRHAIDALALRASMGKSTGGIPAYGYDVDKITKELVINEQEAFVVNQIFEKYAAGISYSEILAWINANGFTTKKNEPFKTNSLHFILKNKKYVGTYVYNKNSQSIYKQKETETLILEGAVPQIVSKKTFDIVQKKLLENKHNSQMTKAKELYILSGRAFCGECGSRLVGNRRKNTKTGNYWSGYQCSGRKKHICTAKEINKAKLEELVINQLENEVFTDEFIDEIASSAIAFYEDSTSDRSNELNSAKARLRDITNQINNAVKAVMDGFASNALKIKLEELEFAKTECTTNIAMLSAKANQKYSVMDIKKYLSLGKGIKSLNANEQQQIIAQFVDRVVVHGNRVEILLAVKTANDRSGLVGDPYSYRFKSTIQYHRKRSASSYKRDSHGHFISDNRSHVIAQQMRDSHGHFISHKDQVVIQTHEHDSNGHFAKSRKNQVLS